MAAQATFCHKHGIKLPDSAGKTLNSTNQYFILSTFYNFSEFGSQRFDITSRREEKEDEEEK